MNNKNLAQTDKVSVNIMTSSILTAALHVNHSQLKLIK